MVDETVNLARRVKRHAWAPDWQLFAVCAPGLEELCAAELTALGLAGVEARQGGVAFAGRLDAAYMANLWLRTAGRVLLRLADFRVRAFSDLARQAGRIPWEVFLPPGAPLAVSVTLKGSNLPHAGQAARDILQAATSRLTELGLAPPRAAQPGDPDRQMVMVRAMDRRASISLDTTGPHLHFRGYRLAPGQAPLREDLAAALLLLAGYDGREPLLDPMCGAGTLAIEAGLLARGLPPLGDRELALMATPAHRPDTWRHLVTKAQEGALPQTPAPILARDISPQALAAAQANSEQAGLSGDISFERADFLTTPPPKVPPGLVVINPPYGKRLGSVRKARELMANLGRKLKKDYQGWRAGVVLYRPEWTTELDLRETISLVAPHGGLKVTLLAGRVA